MAFTGAIQLAYNRNQHTNRQLGNLKSAHCMSTIFRRYHTKILEVEQTHQSNFILQDFISKCRHSKANRQSTILSKQDVDQALTCCVKMVKQIIYAPVIRNLIEQKEFQPAILSRHCKPLIDNEGLLRVGGRLQESTLPYQTLHQMILPSNHHITHLVVSAEHIRFHHAGPQLLIASLRKKYWIPRIRNFVRTVINQCITCYRFKAQATQQLMVELPSTRVQTSKPFLTTRLDYAGPISLRFGPPRSKTITKRYIAIFVCFVTKAVTLK